MNAEQMEEIKRHVGVVAEALRSDIRQIAEGHAAIRHELQEHRGEIRDEFKEMRALLRLSFSQLDQRVHTPETDLSALKARMDRLESSWAYFPPTPFSQLTAEIDQHSTMSLISSSRQTLREHGHGETD